VDTLTREPEVGDEVREPDVLVPSRPPRTQPGPAQVLLAALSLCAAVIHVGFAPSHFSEVWSHGAFFIAMAWYQLLLAFLLVTRPKRWVYVFGLLNLLLIGVWVMSRTVGAPFGGDAWTPEGVGFPDVLATVFEGLIVVGCLGLLLTKAWRRAARWTALSTVGVASVSLIAAGLTTASLTPRFAGAHDHGGTAEAADGHSHGGAAGAAATAGFVLTGTTPCEKSGPPASEGSLMDAEGHNHRGPVEQIPLDRPTTELLQQQQAIARGVADRLPTVAAAEAAGYHKSTPFVPCIGAHYTNVSLVPGFDPAKPSELLFDGTAPDSKIVGLSYLTLHPGGAPDGFAGPNDHWHQHNANGGLCFSKKDGIVIGAEDMTAEQCAAAGGRKQELTDIWMLHDWIVPGWECSWGVFAPECAELGGRVGTDAWTQ
jgi:hypothetical protein